MKTVELLNQPKNVPAQHDRTLGEILKAKAISIQNLPMMPEAGIKALALAKDPNTSFKTLATAIERDPALTTGILRLANSPLYRLGRTVSSIEQAILRLGLRECQNVIVTVAMRSLYRKLPGTKKGRCEALWRHSFTTACISRRLNLHLDLGYKGEEFSSALCHDLGRLIVALAASAYFDLADPMTFQETPAILTHEQNILGTDHCAFGAWFAYVNELPDTLVAAIQHHHNPDEANHHRGLVGLIALADDMANFFQREKKTEGYDHTTNLGWQFLAPTWDEEVGQKFAHEVGAILQEVAAEVEQAFPFSVS